MYIIIFIKYFFHIDFGNINIFYFLSEFSNLLYEIHITINKSLSLVRKNHNNNFHNTKCEFYNGFKYSIFKKYIKGFYIA